MFLEDPRTQRRKPTHFKPERWLIYLPVPVLGLRSGDRNIQAE